MGLPRRHPRRPERAAYLVSAAGASSSSAHGAARRPARPRLGPAVGRPARRGEPDPLVDVTAAADVDGWLVVVEGETPSGAPVVVCHSPEPALRTVASSMPSSTTPTARAATSCGTATSCAAATTGSASASRPSCRTVLWGWAGEPLPQADLARVEVLLEALRAGLADELGQLLTAAEVRAVRSRAERLLRTRTHPLPQPGWPAIRGQRCDRRPVE